MIEAWKFGLIVDATPGGQWGNSHPILWVERLRNDLTIAPGGLEQVNLPTFLEPISDGWAFWNESGTVFQGDRLSEFVQLYRTLISSESRIADKVHT